jgi:Protein of unknown function (DUF3515)
MVDLETRPPEHPNEPDHTMRNAALWSAAIAVPIAILAGVLIFTQVIRPAEPGAQPAPTASAASVAPVPATPVQVAAPKLSERAATVCLAVTSQLPTSLRNLPARKVTAGPEQNAAYGEPPITVQCGGTQPAMCATLNAGGDCVPLDTELLNMDNVCWYAKQGTAATAFTTMDREIAVQVTVPSSYQQAAQWANEFSDVVVETDASKTAGVPSGCV